MTTSRVARIFVSSTFQDMHGERDILSRSVFPRLRERFRHHGAELCEIDLRWGITREDAAEGRVLPICLSEIDHSRPLFIAILGARYGWIDPTADATLARGFQNLRPFACRSVTELEVRHAVLNPPITGAPCAGYFYLRRDLGDGDGRATALAAELRSAFPDRCRSFVSPQDLSTLVETDVSGYLDLLRAGEQPVTRHLAARCELRHSHVGTSALPEALLDDVVACLRKPRTRFALVGCAGSGKTSILAAALDRFEAQAAASPPQDLSIVRGLLSRIRRRSTSGSAPCVPFTVECALGRGLDWRDPVREIAYQLQAHVPWMADPERMQSEDLLEETRRGLVHVAALHPVTLAIDGIDDLAADSRSGPSWLQVLLSAPVGACIACRPGPVEQTLKSLRFQMLDVPPLGAALATEAARRYFAAYGRKLEDRQASRLAGMEPVPPSILRIRLQELRLFGRFETLDAEIARLDSIRDMDGAIRHVVDRVSADSSLEIAGACPLLIALVVRSRCGLSDAELLSLMARARGQAIGQRALSELLVSLGNLLAIRGGRIVAASAAIGHALAGLELPDVHNLLLGHFLGEPGARRAAEEVPALFIEVGAWEQFAAFIARPDVLAAFAQWQPQEYLPLAALAQDRCAGTFLPMLTHAILESMASGRQAPSELGLRALLHLGAHTQALDCLDRSTGTSGGWDTMLAEALAGAGRIDEAGMLISRLLDDPALAADIRRMQSMLRLGIRIDLERGDLARASERTRALCASCEEAHDHAASVAAQVQLGDILVRIGQFDHAERLFEAARTHAERQGDALVHLAALGNLAVVARLKKRPKEALRMHEREAALCAELGDAAGMILSVGNQALARMDIGDFDAALDLLDSRLALAHERGDRPAEIDTRVMQAVLYRRLGQTGIARRLLEGARLEAVGMDQGRLVAEIDAALEALTAAGR